LKVEFIQLPYYLLLSPSTSPYKLFSRSYTDNISSDSNTTLPHPSADMSPSACIESADVPISRTHTRHSSFQLPRIGSSRPKAKGPLASGLVSPTDGLPNGIPWAGGSTEQKGLEELTLGATAATGQPDGQGQEEESEDQRAERERDEQGHREGERKKGLLRKLQLHKV
jgi:hypothetical protein